MPAAKDARGIPMDRFDGIADRIEHWVRRVEAAADIAEEVRQPPACGLRCGGLTHPAQQSLGAIGFGGGEAAGLQLFQRGALSRGEALGALEGSPALAPPVRPAGALAGARLQRDELAASRPERPDCRCAAARSSFCGRRLRHQGLAQHWILR